MSSECVYVLVCVHSHVYMHECLCVKTFFSNPRGIDQPLSHSGTATVKPPLFTKVLWLLFPSHRCLCSLRGSGRAAAASVYTVTSLEFPLLLPQHKYFKLIGKSSFSDNSNTKGEVAAASTEQSTPAEQPAKRVQLTDTLEQQAAKSCAKSDGVQQRTSKWCGDGSGWEDGGYGREEVIFRADMEHVWSPFLCEPLFWRRPALCSVLEWKARDAGKESIF